jgi:uroporphyrinogen-III decarboxylase
MYKHPKEFNELYEIIEEKAEEYYKIVSDSPAEVVASWENIDGVMTSPRLFEKYCLPFYNKMGRILHQKGKIYLVHFDGRLNCLKNLIRQAGIDVVESFTPPPIGDLPLREAKALWGKRIVIWTNIPQTILLLGADETKKFTRELLRSAAPGDNFILGIMEMVPPHSEGGLRAAIETVAQYGRYPVSPY